MREQHPAVQLESTHNREFALPLLVPYGTLVLLAGMLAVLLLACGPTATPRTTVTTVLLVRHAERLDNTWNSPLSEEGERRAQTLAHVAADAGVTAVYASEYTRTHQTVQPLATHLDLPVKHVSAGDVEGLVEKVLSQNAGEVVMVSGHSDTVPQIIAELRGDAGPATSLAPDEYDNLFVVTHRSGPGWPAAEVSAVNLQYGKPSGPRLPGGSEDPAQTTILLVSYPEAGSAGVERAKALAHVIAKAPMTAVYVPSQEAVLVSTDFRGPEPTTYDSNDIGGLVNQVLSHHAGQLVGIAGQNDVLSEIIEQFGGGPLRPITRKEYDKLFVITAFEPGEARVVSLQYGAPSP